LFIGNFKKVLARQIGNAPALIGLKTSSELAVCLAVFVLAVVCAEVYVRKFSKEGLGVFLRLIHICCRALLLKVATDPFLCLLKKPCKTPFKKGHFKSTAKKKVVVAPTQPHPTSNQNPQIKQPTQTPQKPRQPKLNQKK
jgi:hypothetical protein